MASVDQPVVFRYQRALDQFRREGEEPPLLKRMSELISLLDLTTTLSSSLSGGEILDAALLIVMGELQASRGGLFVRRGDGEFELQASRRLPAAAPSVLHLEPPAGATVIARGDGTLGELFETYGLELLCPVLKADRCIALLGIGPRPDARPYAAEEAGFLQSVAACAATPIENGLIYSELERLNQRLSLKVFQLNNLFDISRELTMRLDEDAINKLVTTTLMGHLMVSRCALYLAVPGGLSVAVARGLRSSGDDTFVPEELARPVLDALSGPMKVSELPEGRLRDQLTRAGMTQLAPLDLGGRVQGFVTTAERVSGVAFTEEDHEFIRTLGRQALAALEGVRLHRVRVEKQRQDRELQIAREIQQSLFPESWPELPGFELAADSRACYQVGGDHYDVIPLENGRVALAIADVSGKSTPASILMASIHASLRALVGSAPAATLMARLNEFLVASTQANKYVTMLYAELDPETRRLAYVNAGHVPPYLLRRDGGLERLTAGGTAVGLLGGQSYEVGEVGLEPGDVVAMVTDGVTEAMSPADEEFDDERAVSALRELSDKPAKEMIKGLQEAVASWTGPAGCSDDLTVLVLKAR